MARYKSRLRAERRYQREVSAIRAFRWLMDAGALLLGSLGLLQILAADFNGAWLLAGAALWAITPRWLARLVRRPHRLKLAVYNEQMKAADDDDKKPSA